MTFDGYAGRRLDILARDRARFGAGIVAELPAVVAELGAGAAFVVTDPGVVRSGVAGRVVDLLRSAGLAVDVFDAVEPNPGTASVERGSERLRRFLGSAGSPVLVIAVGGGSSMDSAKVIALHAANQRAVMALGYHDETVAPGPPVVAIPTTAGTGSEVGRSSVIIMGHRKRVIFHPALLASLVILDPEFTRELPPKLTAATGADALTHCIESFTSPVFHPLCDGIALEGIHLVGKSLARAVKNGGDLEARGLMQIAAAMGAIAFQKDLGATHSLAHPLSSLCGLHHGLANALCLPFVMDFNAARKPGLYRRVGIALDLADPSDAATIAAVRTLLDDIGLAPGLRAHGVDESKLDALSEQAFADSCHATNPVPVTREDLCNLYRIAL